MVDGVDNINWDKAYSIEELLPVITAISPYSQNHISEVLKTLDQKKLSYVLHVLKQPLTSTRNTNESKVEILRELSKSTKKAEEVPTDTFMEILRKVSEKNNGFEADQDNRNYLRNLLNAYRVIKNINTIIDKRKISSSDIWIVLDEMAQKGKCI